MRAAVLVLLAVVLVPAASAFESLPGGPHDDITAASVREAGMSEEVVKAIVEAVRDADVRDNALEPSADKVVRIEATEDYRPEHHCDRVPPSDDRAAFDATAAFVANRSVAAVAAGRSQNPEGALRHIGELLHAVQDCMSHSNAVDLADPQAVVQAINGHAAVPDGLRLTGFQPGADDPETPSGDAYPHADFAKDSGDKNDEAGLELPDGHTKFEAARELAIDASILALQDVLAQLTPAEVQALADAQAAGGQPIPRVGVPAPAWTLALAAIAAAATLARRR
ncbi:MAG: hypothetical protein ACYC2H_08755 [Thermoplasmatota archaeon]